MATDLTQKMNPDQFMKIRNRLTDVLSICAFMIILSVLFSCTPPGGNQKIPQIKITIQNTLPVQRKDVPIVVTLAELRGVAPDFSFDAYLVVTGQPPAEIHSQADDTNYDGQRDELVFLIDLEPQETKEVVIRYSPDNPMTVVIGFTKRTRAGIFPELNGVAALESDKSAYLLKHNGSVLAYGKRAELLFNIDERFQGSLDAPVGISPDVARAFGSHDIQLSQNTKIDIQQPNHRWLITDQADNQKYFVRLEQTEAPEPSEKAGKQLNVYQTKGLSLASLIHPAETESDEAATPLTPLNPTNGFIGCGGFALWDTTAKKFITPPNMPDYVRILANGAVRAMVERIIPDWKLKESSIQLRSIVSIYAGNRWMAHRIRVENLPPEYRIATGIPNLGGKPVRNEKEGWVATWNTQNVGVGMGIIYPVDEFDSFQSAEQSDSDTRLSTVLLRPNDRGEVTYRAFAVWGEEADGPQTQDEFDQYVKTAFTERNIPPIVQLHPQAE